MKKKTRFATFITVPLLMGACTTGKNKGGCQPPECHMNPPPQTMPASEPAKESSTLPVSGCQPPDCHMNPPPTPQ
jgi:hypothetical protein